MRRIATILWVLSLLLAMPTKAQIKEVTVREINQLHPDSLALLKQLGTSLTAARINQLIRSPLNRRYRTVYSSCDE